MKLAFPGHPLCPESTLVLDSSSSGQAKNLLETYSYESSKFRAVYGIFHYEIFQ